MIAWVSKEKKQIEKKINYDNLKKIIYILRNKENNEFYNYVIDLFDEYDMFLQKYSENVSLVIDNLKLILKNKLLDCTKDLEEIKKNKVVLSSSHENTYYVIKELNKSKKENVLVICLDMHIDAYDYNDNIWKGNIFSKLLKEKYISNLLVIGVPSKNINNAKKDIPIDIKSKVDIITKINIEKYLLKYKPCNVYISIDIDCLNTRKEKYTAIEYSPATILRNISYISIDTIDILDLKETIKNCILVKNDLGYANLYKIGENKMNFSQLKTIIADIKQLCNKYGINLGFNYEGHIFGEITEINGYDYGNLTSELIIKLIDELV